MDAETLKGAALIISFVAILGGVPVFLARKSQRGILLPFMLGIFLGPAGWIVAALMKPPLTPAEQARLLAAQQLNRSSPSDWM
jgi:hypothetical protein